LLNREDQRSEEHERTRQCGKSKNNVMWYKEETRNVEKGRTTFVLKEETSMVDLGRTT